MNDRNTILTKCLVSPEIQWPFSIPISGPSPEGVSHLRCYPLPLWAVCLSVCLSSTEQFWRDFGRGENGLWIIPWLINGCWIWKAWSLPKALLSGHTDNGWVWPYWGPNCCYHTITVRSEVCAVVQFSPEHTKSLCRGSATQTTATNLAQRPQSTGYASRAAFTCSST